MACSVSYPRGDPDGSVSGKEVLVHGHLSPCRQPAAIRALLLFPAIIAPAYFRLCFLNGPRDAIPRSSHGLHTTTPTFIVHDSALRKKLFACPNVLVACSRLAPTQGFSLSQWSTWGSITRGCQFSLRRSFTSLVIFPASGSAIGLPDLTRSLSGIVGAPAAC